jgi:hypothetical protein
MASNRDPNQLDTPDTQFFLLKGGVDQVSPALTLPPGICRDAINFECSVLGGYSRIAGFERFDGRPSPSEQAYWTMEVTLTGAVATGNTITGATSTATAVVAFVAPDGANAILVTTKLTGSFAAGETLKVGGVAVGVTNQAEQRSGALTAQLDAKYAKYAADIYRADIQKVPGSGRVLGVWMYNDVKYAFRNTVDGSAAKMYKATSTGWTEVVTGVTLAPGGAYEFVNANFGGSAAMKKMYGCDGVNKAFQFDGTTFTQITTGMAVDTPRHIEFHKNFLFLAFGASLQHSPIGDPTAPWSVVIGAGEIALGDNITSIKSYTAGTSGNNTSSSNSALLIHTNTKTQILYGSSEADFSLGAASATQGGVENSVQLLDQPYFMSDLGIVNLATTQAFGNFQQSALSQQMNGFVLQERSRILSSCIVRSKSQYRLFFNDGYGLYLSFINGKIIGLMPVNLGIQVACLCSLKTNNNEELLFFGDDQGYVYQMDKGPNFDGAPISSYLFLAFAAFKSPRYKKRWRRAALEVSGTGYFEYSVAYDLGWGTVDIGVTPGQMLSASLKPSIWDQFVWDQFFWDGRSEGPTVVPLDGSSENIGLRIISEGDSFDPFTVASCTYHFSMRRQLRSDN